MGTLGRRHEYGKTDAFFGCNVLEAGMPGVLGALYCRRPRRQRLPRLGDIAGVYKYGCEFFQKRIECAVMMKVAETVEETLDS